MKNDKKLCPDRERGFSQRETKNVGKDEVEMKNG